MPGHGRRRRTERNRNAGRPDRGIAGAGAAVIVVGVLVLVHVAMPRAAAPSAASVKPRLQAQTGTATTENWQGTGLAATALGPSKFAAGACVKFAPSGAAHRDETVFIDAGHGGIDPGGNGKTQSGAHVNESAVNLAVTLDAVKDLAAAGYQVVVSRTEQTTVLKLGPGDTDNGLLSVRGAEDDIAARDQCANLAHADLLIGIYMNAGSADEAGSVTTYDAVRPFAKDSQRFARLLQSDVLGKVNATGAGVPDGGVLDDTSMGSTLSSDSTSYGHLELLGPAYKNFTTPSRMPGALIEPLFLSDPSEASIAASPQGQKEVAGGMAQAAESYFAAQSAAGSTASRAAASPAAASPAAVGS